MVIKPGTYTLKIRYWVKDIATGMEGTITKTLSSAAYDQNKYYNITANFDVRNYDGDHYYMWDAQDQYWAGYNSSQPKANGGSSNDYAQSNTDSRYYHEGNGAFHATRASCKDLPNVNEMSWYIEKGEPRWDADELWTTMGHLYKGGMWFKKNTYISGFNANTAVDGSDWRTKNVGLNRSASNIPLSAAESSNYFYLPALGYYLSGQLNNIGIYGNYWSSSTYPQSYYFSYSLLFFVGNVILSTDDRSAGFRAQPFSDFGED